MGSKVKIEIFQICIFPVEALMIDGDHRVFNLFASKVIQQ